ncbi:MAG: 2-C-methyl-D-erythritol 4-phosphate cytidylyltransferase, partial [Eubacterium sp.]|nr:2-C-methyl-D-erythritol 4-phosphate cytidylyltransferase [Eubacterium sp.]
MSNVAIVLGAGSGTRMKSEKSKLLLEIDGKTVIERSVNAFLNISDVDDIIVTVREQDLETFANLLDDERITFVIGGDTRQKSVKNAVDTIDSADMLIIHDGARPLISKEDIENTVIAAKDCGAAAVGVPVKDTIKVIDGDNFIVDTPDRSKLFAVQTPQIFDFK